MDVEVFYDIQNKLETLFGTVKVQKNFNAIVFDNFIKTLKLTIEDLILNSDLFCFFIQKQLLEKSNIKTNVRLFSKEKDFNWMTEQELNSIFNQLILSIEYYLFTHQYFNYFIFSEIRAILKYYLTIESKWVKNNGTESYFTLNSTQFHEQVSLYKYIFSVFDKVSYIMNHLNNKYNKSFKPTTGEQTIKFTFSFVEDSKFLLRDEKHKIELEKKVNLLTRSNAWHFIRKLRNILEHDFIDPTEKYNFININNLLFILLGYFAMAICENFKSDQEINHFLKNN